MQSMVEGRRRERAADTPPPPFGRSPSPVAYAPGEERGPAFFTY